MEGIDVENIDDVNDLEARLYAQVHHEPFNENNNSKTDDQSNCLTTVAECISKALPFKCNWNDKKLGDGSKSNGDGKSKRLHVVRNPLTIDAQKATAISPKDSRNKRFKNINDKMMTIRPTICSAPRKQQQFQQSQFENLIINPLRKLSSSLRLNPVALNGKKQEINATSISNVPPVEKRRLLKLQKHKHVQNKRLTEKLNIKKIEKKVSNDDTIHLDSTDESDSSDVIILSSTPPPIINIDESDNDDTETRENAVVCQNNNSCSTYDVLSVNLNLLPSAGISEKPLENSRCTSPCSILSANDFIEQRDRTHNRLSFPNPNSGADDADLLLLTAEVENLTAAKKNCITDKDNDANITSKTHQQTHQFPEDFVQLEDNEDTDANTDDMANMLKKPSLINVIDSDSEMANNVGKNSVQNSNLTRKRKMLSKHRGHQRDHVFLQDDTDDNDDDVFTLRKRHTSISYIVRGPAVEKCTLNKRSLSIEERSTTSSRCRDRCVESSVTSNAVSAKDKEFITALNNLIQGNDNEVAPASDNILNENENEENIPTAQEIVESVPSNRTSISTALCTPTLLDVETATPQNIVDNLNEIFQTIDQQERQKQQSIHNEHAQILDDNSNSSIEYSNMSTHLNNCFENGSPVYNVTFIDRGDFEYRQCGGVGWNEEMTKFYNHSWNGELFQLNQILHKMNPDKNLWKIYSEDRFNKPIRRNLKCTNCCEFGHIRSKCKRPRKPLICYMCGERGHHEPRCPNTICLRCGNKTQVFVKSCSACAFQNRLTCPICNVRGHSINLCPDKWRRYHSTIEPNVYPNHTIQYNAKKYCCVCGIKGHLGENCRNAIRILEYPIIVSAVKSHAKSYEDLTKNSSKSMLLTPTSIGVNLMYKPFEEFQFKLALNTKKNKVYGRFLTAVGMSSLLSSKRTIKCNLSQRAPNQVPEVSASVEIVEESTKNNDNVNLVNEPNEQQQQNVDDNYDVVYNSESEGVISESIQLNVTGGSDSSSIKICNANTSEEQLIDSDSNYSFSEHFDVNPTSTSTFLDSNDKSGEANLINNVNGKSNDNVKMHDSVNQTLPDFIPLMNTTKDVGNNKNNLQNNDCNNDKNNSNNNNKPPSPQPIRSEAKIYLTHVHSKYLLSPEGHDFLNTIATTCNVKARIDVTSVGHVVIIDGLHADQDKFYKNLLTKYDEISENEAKHHSNYTINSVPKRVGALIRFLRDNINQLQCNLGNPNDLHRRLKYLDKIQSKGSIKLADKARRLLNMILLGQAGLLDGHIHLNNLLDYLKCLTDYQGNGEELTPVALRNNITENWKLIFTPYRHDNYQQLVQMYNKLLAQDRLPKLNLNLTLLGRAPLNYDINTIVDTNAIARKSDNQSNNNHVGKDRNKVIKPLIYNASTEITTPQTNTSTIRVQYAKINSLNSNLKANYYVNNQGEISMNTLINSNEQLPTTANNSKIPSSFWSNQSIRYLDKCILQACNQPQLLEKLQCVRNKSSKGQLSYNDYLAVIKLHKALVEN